MVPVGSAWADRGALEKAGVFGPDNPLRTGTVRGPPGAVSNAPPLHGRILEPPPKARGNGARLCAEHQPQRHGEATRFGIIRRLWASALAAAGCRYGKVGVLASMDSRKSTRLRRSCALASVSTPAAPALRCVTLSRTSSSVCAA